MDREYREPDTDPVPITEPDAPPTDDEDYSHD
jgi:hypothetical protein